jgi:hypothetical protein
MITVLAIKPNAVAVITFKSRITLDSPPMKCAFYHSVAPIEIDAKNCSCMAKMF